MSSEPTRDNSHDEPSLAIDGHKADSEEMVRLQARVLESMVEGVSVADEKGFILITNRAKNEMFGYEEGELIGKHVSVLNTYPPEENARIVEEIIESLKRNGSWSGEFSNRRKDGTRFTTAARISAMRLSGKVYWVSVQEDITERRRAEKVQAATYKISEAANAAEDLQALFRSIHEIVGELLPVKNFYIALYDEESEAFDFPYFVDERSPLPTSRRLGRGLTEYTFRTGQPVSAPPLVLEDLVRKGEAQLSGAAAIDWFGVPLKIRDKAIGVLVVQSYTEGVTFGEDEKNILVFVSEQIAMAIDRKRADEERRRLLELERAARSEAEQLNVQNASMLKREQQARTDAETAHREWQTTFDAMTDLVLLVDREDRLIRANRAFYERLGHPPEMYTGQAVGEVVHNQKDTLADGRPCPLCELRKQGTRQVIELQSGALSDYPILASTDPILDSEGNTIAVLQVVRDQTELYRAREEAERSRMSMDVIVEQMAEGLVVWDETMRVVRANRQAQMIFGFTFEEMRDDLTQSLAVGRFADEADQHVSVSDLPVKAAMREHRIVAARLWYTKPDGNRAYLSLTASPIFNDQKTLAGAILVARDITERHRETDRAQQADKLRALGQLASGVAHNFNNALAAVIGYTQLALPKVKDTPVEKYLNVVEQSAKDAARMVERIQNFSRGSQRKDDFMRMRLSDIVRDAMDITRPRWRNDAEASGIKYRVTLDWNTEEDLIVNGAPSELREVFVNIILNAIDAMMIGGSISITASADDTNVSIRFTDSGTGMTEETMRRIFDPFFTTKGTSGLGMGLSESYRIIERHGGRIEVESQPQHGTTFTIILPHANSERALAANQSNAAVPIARILIIDDEEPIRRVLADILGHKGHVVSSAGSAAEALLMLDEQDFDVVFTDLAMPKTDGVTTAAEIKAKRPSTKIVLMSGYGAEMAYERAAETSCIDFALSKPFRMQDINEALRVLLNPNS